MKQRDHIGEEQDGWKLAFGVAGAVNRLGGGIIDIWLPGVGKELSNLVDQGLTAAQKKQLEDSRAQQDAALIVALPSKDGASEYDAVAVVPLPKNLSKGQLSVLKKAIDKLLKSLKRRQAARLRLSQQAPVLGAEVSMGSMDDASVFGDDENVVTEAELLEGVDAASESQLHIAEEILGEDEAEAKARAEAQALAEAEAKARAEAQALAVHAKASASRVSPTGGCRCPRCGVALRLVRANGSKSGGATGGFFSKLFTKVKGISDVDIFGWVEAEMIGAKLQPTKALRAGSSCFCQCPNCGAHICLTLGPNSAKAQESRSEILGHHQSGIDVLGAPLPFKAFPKGIKLSTAMSSSKDSVARLHTAGQRISNVSKSKLSIPKPLTAVKGIGTEIAGAMFEATLDSAAADAAMRTIDVFGAMPSKRRSAKTEALALKASSARARAAAAHQAAASAPAKVVKANRLIEKHTKSLNAFKTKAAAAGSRGSAGKTKATDLLKKLESAEAKVKKLKTKVSGDPLEILGDQMSDQAMYKNMPDDAVEFPKYKGWDRESKGSYSYFYGGIEGLPNVKGAPAREAGYIWAPSYHGPIEWIARYGYSDITHNRNAWNAIQDDDFVAPHSEIGVVDNKGTKFGKSFGPIIGNPTMPDYKGLHFAINQGKWFWLAGEAPKWATKELDDALALAAKIKQEADDEATELEKEADELEKKKQQAEDDALAAKNAREDAALARAAEVQEKQLKMEADKAEADLKLQQQKDDADYEREQKKFEREQKTFEQEQAREQAKIDLERQRKDMERQSRQPEYQEPSDEGDAGFEQYTEQPEQEEEGGVDWGEAWGTPRPEQEGGVDWGKPFGETPRPQQEGGVDWGKPYGESGDE